MSNKKNEHTQIGWPTFPIGELLTPLDGGRTLHQGWSPRCEKEPSISETEWGVLKTTSIQPAAFLPEHNKRLPSHLEPRPQIEVKPGDILITCAGPRNRCGIACLVRITRRRLMMSGKMYRFRPDPARVDPHYLEAYLQSADAQGAIDEMKTGGNESGLNLTHDRFRKLPVPVAPLDQQKRIVSEIEKQFSRLDEAVANLKRVKANLKRYKAAVLKAAVEGRLVETEAELARREGRSYETGAQLLQRILETRRSQWQGKGKYKEPAAPDAACMSVLPEGWISVSVEQIAKLVTDGDHNPPKRTPSGVPHLTAKHIREWRIDSTNCTFISTDDAVRVFKRYLPKAGDLIVTCVGTVGRTAIVPDRFEFSPDRNLAAIRFFSTTLDAKFLQIVLESPDYQKLLRGASGSTAQPHLYLSDLRAMLIPLVPMCEQHRMVAEVDRRLSLLRDTEAQVDANLQRAERLRQSILQSAFSKPSLKTVGHVNG